MGCAFATMPPAADPAMTRTTVVITSQGNGAGCRSATMNGAGT